MMQYKHIYMCVFVCGVRVRVCACVCVRVCVCACVCTCAFLQIIDFDGDNKFSGNFTMKFSGSTPIACNFALNDNQVLVDCIPDIESQYIVDPARPPPIPSGKGFLFTLNIKNKAE